MKPSDVLILPGWQSSGAAHWQTRWERAHGYRRVEQHDWLRPLRGDWIARLEEVLLLCDEPAVLVAHSLGCLNVAAWAAHSRNTHRVKAALLVALPDVEREAMRPLLPSWSLLVLHTLPFKTVMVTSGNDPFCAPERLQKFAAAWGADSVDAGARGHLNADSGVGGWPEGHEQLRRLIHASHSEPSRMHAPSSFTAL